MKNDELPELATVRDVARWLHTTPKGVYAMVARGLIPGVVKVGRRVLFARASLVRWLEQRRASSPME